MTTSVRRVSRVFFEHWRRGHPVRALIERFELGLPVEHHSFALDHCCHPHHQPAPPAQAPATVKKKATQKKATARKTATGKAARNGTRQR